MRRKRASIRRERLLRLLEAYREVRRWQRKVVDGIIATNESLREILIRKPQTCQVIAPEAKQE